MRILQTCGLVGLLIFAASSQAFAEFPDCIAPVDNPGLYPSQTGAYPSDPAIPYSGGRTVWSTNGLEIQLSKNGKGNRQFMVEGINYEPTQIGGSADYSPFNDFFYTNDTELWVPLWNRDIDLMRAMGVNAIRTYGFWKWEPGFNQKAPGNHPDGVAEFWQMLDFSAAKANENNKQFCFPGNKGVYAFQHPTHKQFLDELWNGGKKPIYVWIGVSLPLSIVDPNISETRRKNLVQFYRYTAKWLAKKYGDHPAVMGFVIGNEIDTPATTPTSEFWEILNDLHRLVKASAPDKLTMNTFHDTADFARPIKTGSFVGRRGPAVYELDVWGFNPYSNPAPDGNLFSRFSEFVVNCKGDRDTANCTKPLLYGEFGVPGNTHEVGDEDYPINWVAPNFIWMRNPPAAQCLTHGQLASPPRARGGPGGDGPVAEYKRGRTIAIEMPTGRGERYDMPKRLARYFEGSGVQEGDDLPAADQAKWIFKFWKVTRNHKADNSSPDSKHDYSSGGFLFEWRDEWWKANPHPDFHSITGNNKCGSGCSGGCDTGAANAVFPGGWGDEQWFGINGAKANGRQNSDPVVNPYTGKLNGGPDILLPRAAVVATCQMYGKCLTPLQIKRRQARRAQLTLPPVCPHS